MTFEEMQEHAQKVVEALKVAGFTDVELVLDGVEPGRPLPIMYTDNEGNTFTAEVALA